jgi:hypothetical protein
LMTLYRFCLSIYPSSRGCWVFFSPLPCRSDDSKVPQPRHPLLGELTVSFVEGLCALQPSDRPGGSRTAPIMALLARWQRASRPGHCGARSCAHIVGTPQSALIQASWRLNLVAAYALHRWSAVALEARLVPRGQNAQPRIGRSPCTPPLSF